MNDKAPPTVLKMRKLLHIYSIELGLTEKVNFQIEGYWWYTVNCQFQLYEELRQMSLKYSNYSKYEGIKAFFVASLSYY